MKQFKVLNYDGSECKGKIIEGTNSKIRFIASRRVAHVDVDENDNLPDDTVLNYQNGKFYISQKTVPVDVNMLADVHGMLVKLTEAMSTLTNKVDNLDIRLTKVEDKLDKTNQKIDDVEDRLNKKIDELKNDIPKIVEIEVKNELDKYPIVANTEVKLVKKEE